MPFQVPWTDDPPDTRPRNTLPYLWGLRASWKPTDWALPLVVREKDTVVGVQELRGKDFTVTRQVSSGSWLGQVYQGVESARRCAPRSFTRHSRASAPGERPAAPSTTTQRRWRYPAASATWRTATTSEYGAASQRATSGCSLTGRPGNGRGVATSQSMGWPLACPCSVYNLRAHSEGTAVGSRRAASSRNTFLSNFPTLVLGISSTKRTSSGSHHLATSGWR